MTLTCKGRNILRQFLKIEKQVKFCTKDSNSENYINFKRLQNY